QVRGSASRPIFANRPVGPPQEAFADAAPAVFNRNQRLRLHIRSRGLPARRYSSAAILTPMPVLLTGDTVPVPCVPRTIAVHAAASGAAAGPLMPRPDCRRPRGGGPVAADQRGSPPTHAWRPKQWRKGIQKGGGS